MSETTGTTAEHQERRPDPRARRVSRLAARWAALGLLLLALYFMAWQTVTTANLRDDLAEAQAATLIAREKSQNDRADLNDRLDEVQDALDEALADNALLREQLTQAGLIPAVPEE